MKRRMDITTSNIPREVADIIVDLNIIARIPTNHKFNTFSRSYADADSVIEAAKRTIYGESGDITIDFINSRIDRAIAICRKYNGWTNHIAGYVDNLSNALTNLESIYLRKRDESTIGKIQLLKIRINRERFLRSCSEPDDGGASSYEERSLREVEHDESKLSKSAPSKKR